MDYIESDFEFLCKYYIVTPNQIRTILEDYLYNINEDENNILKTAKERSIINELKYLNYQGYSYDTMLMCLNNICDNFKRERKK